MDLRGIHITDGTDRAGRKSPALASGYINVDELNFEELLAMGSEFASVINFYNLKNKINGNWGELFNADEAIIMAMILSTDLKRLESDFLNISSDSQEKLASFILDVANKINFWFTRLKVSQHKSGETLALKIAMVITEKLAVELHNAGEIITQAEGYPDQGDIADFSVFGSIWRLGKEGCDNLFPESNISEFSNYSNIKQQLRTSFYSFSNAITYLKMITPIFLQESLGSQQHNPAIGLFIVFLKMYKKAQQKLNTFTNRHLDFYYEQILQIKNRGQVAESVYLLFETQSGTEKALIEKNTEFSAGKDEALNEIIYCADDDLVVTGAKVKSLATLYLQHDRLISPESELGYVTRMKSDTPQLSEPGRDKDQLISWPLFGAEKQGINSGTSTDTAIGFSVASPLLMLKEGVRKIEMNIELENMVMIDIDTMVSNLLKSTMDKDFTRLFGRIFAQYLQTYKGCLTPQHKYQIITKAESMFSKHMADEINALLTQDWQGLFYKLFKEIFCIKLTTEKGWLDVNDYIVVPYSEGCGKNKPGLRILLSLGQEADPITSYTADAHGGELETDLPVFQCHINPQTNFYPYSIFQGLVISSLQIKVDVKGVKNILAYNHHGQVDPSKPFQPFGPIPTSNSYFIFGNYELARKPLVDLNVNLEWGELPRLAGGFGEHYHDYEAQYSNSTFKGEFTALSDSSWLPYDSSVKKNFSLFESEEDGSRLSVKKRITVNVLDYNKTIDVNINEDTFQYDLKARNGFFKLSLAGTELAFGHAEYARLLSKVLSANARLKKPKQVPNPPYTPTLNSFSLDYTASSWIDLAERADEHNDLLEKIIHIHPFGTEIVYPAVLDKPCFLMPQYAHEGNLFIGLSAKDLSGIFTLFFRMSDEFGQERRTINSSINWFYLSSNTWKEIPAKRVLTDTTNGFISSGIVTLNLPKDISRDNSVMPGGYFWIRVSATENARSFCNIYSIQTHAVKVSRKNRGDATVYHHLPDTIKWTPIHTIPGIGSINQAGKPFGGRPCESDSELKTRVSERLRHKNRAQAPWDYERLILEQFPQVCKVKCFSNISSVEESIKPGHVLIVVVPYYQSYLDEACTRVMIDPEQLGKIKSYVKNLSSPFVKMEVRNPVYEQVQVRCMVKFVNRISDGRDIKRLNQEISDYICPWKSKGYKARFGWSIRQKDIESYIRSLSYVDFVTNFSMLHITMDSDGNYSLFDTARIEKNNESVIRPKYPWSLAMPANKHFIDTLHTAKSIKARITGVNELEVGSTLIISGNNEYGQEE